MSEKTKVDLDYKEAFNLGYELAKELNLKTPMFQEIDSGQTRIKGIQSGMAEYTKEIAFVRDKKVDSFIQGNEKIKYKDKGLGPYL